MPGTPGRGCGHVRRALLTSCRRLRLCNIFLMAQLFSPRANTIAKVSIVAGVATLIGAGWASYAVFWSPYTTYVRMPQ